jgi:predicted RNA binding protein YcfA (HicA-like mRNA interferase family)
LKSVSGKIFCRLLENKGWKLKQINGSHHIYTRSGTATIVSVLVHGNKPLKIGLQKHLMKVSGIENSELI